MRSLLICCLMFGSASAAEKPNIVLIVADDLGRNDLGCYGSKYHRTPQLDRLAKEGIQFENAYSACPVCSPTRAALMTGKYPARLHITDWLPGRGDRPDQILNRPMIQQQLPLQEVTIAERLKAMGYATAHIGKWHLGGVGFGPKEQGFDLNIAGDHTGTPMSYFAPFQSKKGQMPGLEEAKPGEYLTDRLTDEAEKFIEQNQKQPFFLYLPHYGVHTPLRAKEKLIAQFPGKAEFGKQSNPVYAAMLYSVDESVGRLRQKLESLQLWQNTIFIFTSDNGGLATLEGLPAPPTFNGPFREGKGHLYEGGIRIPFIVHSPGSKAAGSKNMTVTSSIDVVPTILDLLHQGIPDQMDGKSIAKAFQGEQLSRESLYWHYPHYSNQTAKPGAVIRDGDYKLIHFFEDGRTELFNIAKDISESRNLTEAEPDRTKKMLAQLMDWQKAVGAQMMTPNSNYIPNPSNPDGSILLHAKTARIHGVQLRFEPLPHKNTLGFWTVPTDWASWEFTAKSAGTYEVEILQGCGKGSGGAKVEMTLGSEKLTFVVEDTGGFQNFKLRNLGKVEVKAGRQTLELRPVSKPGVAVMDVRQIVLRPTKKKD